MYMKNQTFNMCNTILIELGWNSENNCNNNRKVYFKTISSICFKSVWIQWRFNLCSNFDWISM